MSRFTVAVAAALLVATSASSATAQTYSGVDVGGGIGGPRTNSTAAYNAWKAAAGAATHTQDFEGIALGTGSPVNIGGGYSLTVTGAPSPGAFDVNSVTDNQSAQIGYNTTVGGSRFFRFSSDFSGTATLTIGGGAPITSFGVWITGVQQWAGATTATWGGNSFLLPDTDVGQSTSGVQFFGFVSASAITEITFTTVSVSGFRDVVGFDDLEFVAASTVPEPSTWALLGTGLAALALVARRHRA